MKRHGSLNHIFRLVWSKVLGSWVAVAENSRGRGKGASRQLVAATLSLSGFSALAAPGGGQVINGSADITQFGTTVNIKQTSQNLSLNWNSFNVGASETVNFAQPGVSSLAVNRILDVNGSQIMGRLNANGQVFLINPNGVLFGPGAQVNVGGIVASTLDYNQGGTNGNIRSFSGNGVGAVINEGAINAASGSYVALVGNRVSNQGSIKAPMGSVVLGAGSAAMLTFSGDQLASFEITQSVLDNLAQNGGLIQADGGTVILSAGAKAALQASMVNNTGLIRAHTVDNLPGNITVLGGMAAGTVNIAGTLDASAPDGGNGGTIDTSAAHVKIADGAKVTTLAANGKTGTWLIDPTDFTISSDLQAPTDSGISAATLSANLVSNNVEIATVASGTGAGDINVNADVAWNAKQLKLTAHNDININAVLTANDTASLNLQPASGKVNVGFNPDGSFKGRVDFFQADGVTARTGTEFLTIGANGYNVIASTADLSAPGYYAMGGNIVASTGAPILGFDNSTFDGLGHTISNLTITGGMNTGLFGAISGATIRNVGLVNGTMKGAAGTGALVGQMTASTISNSYSTLDVTGDAGTGGLVGRIVGNDASSISNSHASGVVAGNAGTGGLVGSIAGVGGSSISNSYASGVVTGKAGAGGLVGSIAGAASGNASNISNSYATGEVTGDAATGGLVGSIAGDVSGAPSDISDSHATGNVNGVGGLGAGGAGTGGLVGSLATNSGNISNSYATGDVTSTGAATGGLVGSTAASGTISDSRATGNVLGDGAGAGGLVGSSAASGDISFSYATGNVESVGAGTGGLVGSNTSGAIFRSFALGDVKGGGAGTGGLAGSNTAGAISQSFAMGDVTGAARPVNARAAAETKGASTGGLVGSNSGTLTDTYAAGNVTGYAAGVGGLVGDNFNTVSNSYAAGVVTGGAGASGVDNLVGFGSGTGNTTNIVNSFWKTQGATSGDIKLNAAGALSNANLTDAELRSQGNFTSATYPNGSNNPGWNFNGIWRMPDSSAAYLYPIFDGLSKVITATVSNQSKTYDGQLFSGTNSVSYSSAIEGNFIQGATFGGEFANAINVGWYSITAPTLTATGSSVVGTTARYVDFLNTYHTVNYVSGTLTVNQAVLTANTVNAPSKTYDGGNSASATLNITAGLVAGESVSATGSGTFSSKDVAASNNSFTVNSVTLADGDNGLASNYTLAGGQSVAATITAKAVTVATTANSKVYDGNDVAALTGTTITGLVGGEALDLSAQFDNKNAANGKAVTLAGVNTATALASNYTLIQPANLTADITAKAVTVATTANSKVYDGNDVAALTGTTITGLVGGEALGLSAQFDNKNAANGKAVTVSGVDTTTGLASNYTVTQPANLTADITAKAVTVAGLGASDKVYDGNTVATVGGGTISGMVAGEALGLSGQFDTKDVANGKAVTVAGVDTTTALASNYALIQPENLTANIVALPSVTEAAQPAVRKAASANFLSSVSTKPADLNLSPPIVVTSSSSVDPSVTGEVGAGNSAEKSLTGSTSADKITSGTMLGLTANLKIIDGGLMLKDDAEDKL
jgi:filamentous hemagglutinin family protein